MQNCLSEHVKYNVFISIKNSLSIFLMLLLEMHNDEFYRKKIYMVKL